jgi:hypothetical protein
VGTHGHRGYATRYDVLFLIGAFSIGAFSIGAFRRRQIAVDTGGSERNGS